METSDGWAEKNSMSMDFFEDPHRGLGSRSLSQYSWPVDRDGTANTISDHFEGVGEPMRANYQQRSVFRESKELHKHSYPLRQDPWQLKPASILSSFSWSPLPSVEGLAGDPQMQAVDEGEKGKVRQEEFWLQRNSSTWQGPTSSLSTSYSNSDPLESHSTLAIPSHPSSSLLTPLSGSYVPLPYTLSSKDSAFYTPLPPLSTHLPLSPIFLSTPDPVGSSDHFPSFLTSTSPPAGNTHPSPTALEEFSSTSDPNWWGLLAILVVLLTAMGNILVILAISWERRLQNMTNYFLLSLAVTDFMVATLVMPLAIVVLVLGHFPFSSELCLVWISLDVLFCTASIMHLCTISVDRFLSLRYPMKFGRHKTRRRVVLKIVLVWCLSLAMSLPLSLMYATDSRSTIVDGVCQIPMSLFQIIGSVTCFYIPLVIMLVTYALTVRLLSKKKLKLTMAATTTIVEPYPEGPPKPSRWKSLLCKTSSNFSNTTATSAVDTDLADVALEGCRYSSEEGESVFSSPMYKRSAYHLRYGSSTTTTTSSSYRGGLPRNTMGIGRSLSPHSPKRSPYSIKELEAEVGRLAVELDEVEGNFYPPVTSSSVMELTVFPPQSSPERLRSANSSNASSPRRSKASEGIGEDLQHNTCRNVSPKHTQAAYETTVAVPLDPRKESLNHDHLREEATSQHRNLQPNRNAGGGEGGGGGGGGGDGGSGGGGEGGGGGGGGGNCHVAVPCSCAPKFFLEGMGTEPANSSPSSSQCVECVDCLDSHSNRPSNLNSSSTAKKKKNALQSKTSSKTSSSSSSCLPSMFSCLRGGGGTSSSSHLPKVTTEASCHDSSLHCPKQGNPDTSPIGSFASSSGAPLPATVSGGPLRRSTSPHRLHRSATESRGRWVEDSNRPVDLIARANTRDRPSHESFRLASAKTKSIRTGTTMASIVRRGSKDSSLRNHSRSSSFKYVFSKRHGRNIRMEQKATKVLGIVFFTFVILWAPFFIINIIVGACPSCGMSDDVINLVTWLGYVSSTVNPFFYTFFNNTFRQTFLKIIQCKMNRTRKYHY